jgi:hypothetical protein
MKSKKLHFPRYGAHPKLYDSGPVLELHARGVTVVPILNEANRKAALAEILDNVRHSPELVEPIQPGTPLLVTLGGFGALGTASSFHFPIVRKLRGEILRKLGSALFSHQRQNLEVLPDRLCLRLNGQAPGVETWHRDVSPILPHLQHSDMVTGGWLNLSNKVQKFSCVRDTHREDRREPPTRRGDTATYRAKVGDGEEERRGVVLQATPTYLIVSKEERAVPIRSVQTNDGDQVTYRFTHEGISRQETGPFIEEKRGTILVSTDSDRVPLAKVEEVAHLDERLDDAEEAQLEGFAKIKKRRAKTLKEKSERIECPPGHFVIFNQMLIHEVLAVPAEGSEENPYAKLFMGLRLTYDNAPLFEGTRAEFEQQGLPLLPSGQKIPQYSSNHGSAFQTKSFDAAPGVRVEGGLRGWSEMFVPEIPRNPKNGCVARFFPSLNEIGHPLAKYTKGDMEVAAGGPRKSWSSVWGLWDNRHWSKRAFSLNPKRKTVRRTHTGTDLEDSSEGTDLDERSDPDATDTE